MNLTNQELKEPNLKDYGLSETIIDDFPTLGANGKIISIIPRKWNPTGSYIEEIIVIILSSGIYLYFFKFQLAWSWITTIALTFFLLLPGVLMLYLIGYAIELTKRILSVNYRNYLRYIKDMNTYKENIRNYKRAFFADQLTKSPITISIPDDKDIIQKANESIKVLYDYGYALEVLSEKYPSGVFNEGLLPMSKNEMKTHFYNMALISKLNNWNDYLAILEGGYMWLSSFQQIDADIIETPSKKHLENIQKLEDLKNEGLSIPEEEELSFWKNTISVKEYDDYLQLLNKRIEERNELLDEFTNFIKIVDDFLKEDWLFFYSMKNEVQNLKLT